MVNMLVGSARSAFHACAIFLIKFNQHCQTSPCGPWRYARGQGCQSEKCRPIGPCFRVRPPPPRPAPPHTAAGRNCLRLQSDRYIYPDTCPTADNKNGIYCSAVPTAAAAYVRTMRLVAIEELPELGTCGFFYFSKMTKFWGHFL